MRKSLGTILAAGIAFSASPAAAEEFSGPFIGAAAGYNRDEIGPELGDGLVLPSDVNRDAAYFQIFAGYDHAVAPEIRLGLEAAFGIGADDAAGLQGGVSTVALDPEYSFDFTARAGYVVSDKALAYVRGGYHNSRVELTLAESGQPIVRDKGDADGWLAGGGVEYAFGNNLRSRVEYRYADLGHGSASWDRHQILAGLAWSF